MNFVMIVIFNKDKELYITSRYFRIESIQLLNKEANAVVNQSSLLPSFANRSKDSWTITNGQNCEQAEKTIFRIQRSKSGRKTLIRYISFTSILNGPKSTPPSPHIGAVRFISIVGLKAQAFFGDKHTNNYSSKLTQIILDKPSVSSRKVLVKQSVLQFSSHTGTTNPESQKTETGWPLIFDQVRQMCLTYAIGVVVPFLFGTSAFRDSHPGKMCLTYAIGVVVPFLFGTSAFRDSHPGKAKMHIEGALYGAAMIAAARIARIGFTWTSYPYSALYQVDTENSEGARMTVMNIELRRLHQEPDAIVCLENTGKSNSAVIQRPQRLSFTIMSVNDQQSVLL
ncbi:hypothetical protein CLF_108623 [Clonorchis sinensis]|uniref:Uncharacterized protein n=1 Tax=Clonorchis sinensis TaxID=79923 RepID=G7YIA0_CLOSI|nr:hypothetical protein CLF_108623 [Clonorchis sinensis]